MTLTHHVASPLHAEAGGFGIAIPGGDVNMDATPSSDTPAVSQLTGYVIDEALAALGLRPRGWYRPLLTLLLWLPARFLASLLGRFEAHAAQDGIVAALWDILPRFVKGMRVRGLAHLPATGPLLIVSNHPGAYDLALVAACLPRHDIKLIGSGVPLLRALPNVRDVIIEVTDEPYGRMRSLRQGIRHLQRGGVLLVPGSGLVDPDPDVLPGAMEALAQWYPSAKIMLRAVPDTRLVLAIVSSVIAPHWAHSPLIRVQREPWQQRKLAEALQIVQQLLLPRTFCPVPRITFAPPLLLPDLPGPDVAGQILAHAQALLRGHVGGRSMRLVEKRG